MPSINLGTHSIVFRHDSNSSCLCLLVKELPLVLVCFLLIWAQYSLTFSLVHNYLITTRRQIFLASMILIPFEICWSLTFWNLWKCVSEGPGWAQKTTTEFSNSIEDAECGNKAQEINPRNNCDQRSDHQNHHVSLGRDSSRHQPRRFRQQERPDSGDDYGERASAEDDNPLDGQDEGTIPLLSNEHPLPLSRSHSYHSVSSLKPRSSTAGPLPLYPIRSSPTQPSSLSFQEQIQRNQRRAPLQLELMAVLVQEPPPFDISLQDNLKTLMCKSDGSKRFCRKCDLFKADRAHHCSSCGKCVLRMDHHCPWLGGRCVGLRNHKFFILFLIWSSLTSIICAVGAIRGLMDFVTISHPVDGQQFQLASLNWAFLVLVGALFGMVLTGFTCYHLYLIAVNRTTIENMERSIRVRPTMNSNSTNSYALLRTSTGRSFQPSESRPTPSSINPSNSLDDQLPPYNVPIYKSDDRLTRSERRKLESGSAKLNVYDLGSKLENYKEIFGVHSPWWEWPLPIRPKGISDGYNYRVNDDHLEKLRELTAEVRLLPPDRANELRFERPY